MSRLRKCKQCGAKKPADKGIQTPVSWFCSSSCAFEYGKSQARAAQERARKKAARLLKEKETEARARNRARKIELRPIKWYADRAQSEFNKFIRLRDAGKPCVSCGRPDDGMHQRHASHYRSRGACSSLRFDESNVHASCSQCNKWKSGNIEGFTPELIRRVGQDEFDRIEASPKNKKWTKEELIEIYESYKEKCKELENKI